MGIVVQAYLVDSARHLRDVLSLCKERAVRMPIRLVKGAYWDEETTEAEANGWVAPQFLNQPETDTASQPPSLPIRHHGALAHAPAGNGDGNRGQQDYRRHQDQAVPYSNIDSHAHRQEKDD